MEMSEEKFTHVCMEMDDAIYELLDGKPALVCIAVLTKLVGEVLVDMQLDLNDNTEGEELLEKVRLAILEAYNVARDELDDDDAEFLH